VLLVTVQVLVYDTNCCFYFLLNNRLYPTQVFIPLQAYLKVVKFIECVQYGKKEHGYEPKSDGKINYHNLSYGTHAEIRNLFTLVVFDTLYPTDMEGQHDGSS